MPEDKKHKRPEFKPPFPVPPLDDANAPVLTNEKDESEPIVIETVPETSAPLPPENEAPPESPPAAAAKPTTNPKFVSKNATTLTREPLSDILNKEPHKSTEKTESPLILSSFPEIDDPDQETGREPIFEKKETVNVKPLTSRPASSATPSASSAPGLLTVGIIVFSLIFGLAGWLLYFNTKFSFFKIPGIPQPTEIPQISPTPGANTVPTPTLPPVNTRATITLEILNGSGVKGIAGSTAEKLEKLGYRILTTGNADKQDYAKTQIFTSSKFITSELLLSDLTKEFSSASISGTLKDSTASARIVIGKDWAK